jgi:hypothetical protein
MKADKVTVKKQPPLPMPGVKATATRFKHTLTDGLVVDLVAEIADDQYLCLVIDPGKGGLRQGCEYRFLKKYLIEVD